MWLFEIVLTSSGVSFKEERIVFVSIGGQYRFVCNGMIFFTITIYGPTITIYGPSLYESWSDILSTATHPSTKHCRILVTLSFGATLISCMVTQTMSPTIFGEITVARLSRLIFCCVGSKLWRWICHVWHLCRNCLHNFHLFLKHLQRHVRHCWFSRGRGFIGCNDG